MPDTPASAPALTDLAACQTRGEFGQLLGDLRATSGLSIRDVSAATGIPVATVGDYFNGRHLPPVRDRILERLVRACGVTDETLIEAWTAARNRVRPTPGRPPANVPAPYRGLDFFRTEDAAWFFGRAAVTERLAAEARRLRAQGLPLVVTGPSGAGKSSLLRAGLIPALAPGTAVVVFTPGPHPARALAAALASGGADGSGGVDESHGSGLAVIVDQFEEVFAPGVAEGERDELIENLYALAQPGPDGQAGALVVLGLRADFYGRALADPRLARSLQDGQVVVGPMTADELRAAIVGPAQAAHLDLEPGLVDLMLRDLRPVSARRGAHDPGALPLLSHALLSTWRGRRSGRLTIEAYRASGGITDAVARSADDAYSELTASQQRAARRLFLRLVWVADDGADTRRRVPLDDLAPAAGPDRGADDDLSTVLGLFVDHRLITSDEQTAEITHEALLTAWPQLRRWIDESREELVIARRIAESAQLWQESGRDDADLLRGGRLAMARGWAGEPETGGPAAAAANAERRATLSGTERAFVDASFARDRAEQAEQRRNRRLFRRLTAALAVVLLVVAALAGYAMQQRSDIGQQRNQADSRQDAAEAMDLRNQDPALADQLSLAAYRAAPTTQARGSLLTSSATPLAARLLGPADAVQSVALSPDHRLLAAAAADGTVRLWDLSDPDHPVSLGAPFVRQSQPVYAVTFSPGGHTLAVAGASGQVELWNVDRPARPVQLGPALTGPAGTIYGLAFSPSGTTLAAGSADGTVRLWTMGAAGAAPAAPGHPVTLHVTGGFVQTVAFSPAGTELAAGTAGGTVAMWALPGHNGVPTALPTLTGPQDVVFSVAFSPDGHTLAAGSKDKTVWLWDVGNRAHPRPVAQFKGATSWINAVAFSPDGSLLADGSSDGSAQVLDVATGDPVATLPDPDPVTTLAWDRAGHLVTGAADGSVRVWALPPAVLAAEGVVNGVAFSTAHPDQLAVASGDLQLWDASRHQPLGPAVTVPGTSPGAAAFSPSGAVLAAGFLDGTLRLYQVTAAGHLVLASPVEKASTAGYVEDVAYSPNGQLLATANDDYTVGLWDVADPARPRKLATLHGFGSYVFSVAFNRAGTLLAAASGDKTVRLWNIADPAHPAPVGPPLTGPSDTAYSVAFDPAKPVLAVGSADKMVWLWDIADPAHPRRLAGPLSGPASYVYSVAFNPAGTMLAAGSTDDTVWLWDLTDPSQPEPLATLTGPTDHVYTVAFSPSGSTLAAGSADGSVHLWDTTAAAAARAVCSMGGDPIDRSEWARYLPGTPYQPPCAG
ncbi:MAG: helix-turn-helix domain-containing protein [Actinobacteria bacterium]|nr:helix-turn-helix domain-containing protein [Actinomycetota bacterium]